MSITPIGPAATVARRAAQSAFSGALAAAGLYVLIAGSTLQAADAVPLPASDPAPAAPPPAPAAPPPAAPDPTAPATPAPGTPAPATPAPGTPAPAASPNDGTPGPDKYPEPSPSPKTWELKFRHGEPKRVVVQLPGQPTATAYWYITYSATNYGDKEEPFEPEFDMIVSLPDSYKTIHGNRAIPGEVFEQIKRKEGNRFLISPRKVAGTINTGEEQTRDSVAIWEEPQRKMGKFSIFVGGLSGETLTMKKVGEKYIPVDPDKAADELKGVKEEDRLTLRKQLQVTYEVIGDEMNVGKDPVVKKGEKWVMR